jgi:hypothetical protein
VCLGAVWEDEYEVESNKILILGILGGDKLKLLIELSFKKTSKDHSQNLY